jgi:hypothetical protein
MKNPLFCQARSEPVCRTSRQLLKAAGRWLGSALRFNDAPFPGEGRDAFYG